MKAKAANWFLALHRENRRLKIFPLREHAEDIDELTTHFLQRVCAENGLADIDFDPAAIKTLKDYAWPGNVRELNNIVQRCALAAEEPVITKADVTMQIERRKG